jgi:hypothetical protein
MIQSIGLRLLIISVFLFFSSLFIDRVKYFNKEEFVKGGDKYKFN